MITPEEIEKLAQLSRMELSADEKGSFMRDIDSILGYVGQIKDANVGSHPGSLGFSKNILREDETPHESSAMSEDILGNAPSREDNFIKVKKILPS